MSPQVPFLYKWYPRTEDYIDEVIRFCLSEGTDNQLTVVRLLCETDGWGRGMQAVRRAGRHPIHVGEMKGLGPDF
jgi:hypothetical protein